MKKKVLSELGLAWFLIWLTVVGWPASYVLPAKYKEDFILGLSWLAILITAVGVLITARTHKDVKDGE